MRSAARLSLVAAGLAAFALAMPASAASAPTTLVLTDASGDQAPSTKGDITKLTYTTSGKTVTKKVGKKITKIYTPDTLVITLETADAIDTSGTTLYEVDSDVAGCDYLDVSYNPGVDGSEFGGCSFGGSDTDPTAGTVEGLDGAPTVAGNKMTFTLHFNGFSEKQVKAGSVISNIHGFTAFVEPVVGIVGPYALGGDPLPYLSNDDLTTDSTYKVG